ncbi:MULTISPECIES: hypothetical protein [Burkholderia]|uniref:Uncharacterized protein n=2 Tax=Burkholderia cepacia complex TaxID=87882 RepID=A0AAP1YCY2_9BURK|nr:MULTISPECIES: hypothetical protein [Burkholderia]MBK1902190.1 hypothetical protein [Burkholderia contaminans]MBK1910473.1 hypothetical protein [Burkholderia contaminans]MBK1923932.1 hypothetical protein [Burkholderia contaminans]MBK1932144.1 hypothetical protein [Burkholderia contaminans]MBK1939393.1 hypothetical protein [Burkholderia contaminans]
MRIPLLHADLEHGSYTKVAKALRKAWPLGELSLMQAQNTLAIVLGYNSLHHAQHEATASFSIPDGSVSLKSIAKGVAWRMFIRYGIELLLARRLVARLHLDELAVAGISVEAKMRCTFEDAAKKGYFYDEASDLLNHREPWPDETPRLLEKGVPAYKWAIYPDRRVFLWPKLVAQIEMLPEDFAKDLREACKLPTDSDVVESFMIGSLMPAACQPLAEALASGDLAASINGQQQWQVKWIVTRQAEVLGCCIVAEKLGGMIPRVFDPDGAEAYAALGSLLCGDVVPLVETRNAGALVSERVCLIGRNRLEQLKDDRNGNPLETQWYYDQWPATINLCRNGMGWLLAGTREFSERGQRYLATTSFDAREQQRLLREEPLFETFTSTTTLIDQIGTEDGVPALGNRWHDAVELMLSTRKAEVEAVGRTQAGTERLLVAVLDNIDSSALDAFVDRAISDCLPLRYDGDVEDNEVLVSERRHTVSLTEHLGMAVIKNMPGLRPYSALSIGYVLLIANGEYPGSRYQGMVDAPTQTDWAGQCRLLAAMLIYEPLSDHRVSPLAMSCAIAPVLGLGNGTWSNDKIYVWYRSACAVERRLKDAQKLLEAVDDWRAIEVQVERVRAQGEFLRAGDPIPVTRPKSAVEALREMYSMARSAGFAVSVGQQDLPSKKEVLREFEMLPRVD